MSEPSLDRARLSIDEGHHSRALRKTGTEARKPGRSAQWDPNGLLCLFERTAWPIVAPEPGARPPREAVRVDVDARMRGMWR